MIELTPLIRSPGVCLYPYFLIVCFLTAIMIHPAAAAADINIEAELGDTLNLHGVSYTGESVYLFMTGPGLPEDGVTLTDVSQRADQGKFTRVDLDDNQEWSFRWNTARIENELNAGTYLVYVTNEPVDKSHLGGSSSYKTLEVFLKDSTTSRVPVSSGTGYTLNPEMHASVQVPTLAITLPISTPTLPTTLSTTELSTPMPTKKAFLPPALTLFAVLLGAFALILKMK